MYPSQNPSIVESHPPASLPQSLRVLFYEFLSRLLFPLKGGVEWSLSQKPSMRLFLNCGSAVINGMTKAASFPFAVSRNMDH